MQPTQKAAQLISLAKLNNYYPLQNFLEVENLHNTKTIQNSVLPKIGLTLMQVCVKKKLMKVTFRKMQVIFYKCNF